MWCQHCGAYIGKDDETCPGCGRPRAEAIPAEAPRPQPIASAPGGPAATSAAPAPWVSPGGPPPTPPLVPAGSPYPAAPPVERIQPPAEHVTPAASAEPQSGAGLGGVSRRGLLLGGALGVVGIALGGSGVWAYDRYATPASGVFWAYPTTGGGAELTINGTAVSHAYTPLLPGAATVVTSQRPATNYLVVATRGDADWQIAYWTAPALTPLTAGGALPTPTTIPFRLPPGRRVAQIYDLRVFVAPGGNDAAVAVAMSDDSGLPQIAYLDSLAHPAPTWRMLVTNDKTTAADATIVGPDTLVGGKTLYLRVSANGQAQTLAVDVTSNLGPPPATPTPKPAPTTSPTKGAGSK